MSESHAACFAARRRQRRLGLRGELAALGGVVGRERLVDVGCSVTSPPAASETSSCHERSVSISSPSSVRSRRRAAARTCSHCAGVDAALAKAVTNCSWLSLPASAACASSHSASATRSRACRPLLGRDIRVRGELQLRERRADRRRLGLCADVAQHEVDVVAGGCLGIPRLIPRRTPHERAGERVADLREVLDRGAQRDARRGGSSRRRGRRR